VGPHGLKVRTLEKAGADILHRNLRKERTHGFPCSFGQPKRLVQVRQFEFHRRRCNASRESVAHISVEPVERQVTGPRMPECGLQGFEGGIEPPCRSTLIDRIIIPDHLHQVGKGRLFEIGAA